MDARPESPVTDAAFEETAERFVASRLPEILAEITTTLRSVRRGITRCGLLVCSADGTHVRSWSDSNGQVIECPPAHCTIEPGSVLARARQEPDQGVHPSTRDRFLEWCSGDAHRTLLVLSVRGANEYYGYLVIETGSADRSRKAHDALQSAALPAWARLAANAVGGAIRTIRMLVGAVRFARDFTLMRDRETGEHQLRLGAYLQVLADEMRSARDLSEGLARELTLFGPLHDIGKIGIADDVLLKPGRFDEAEWIAMKRHVDKGRALVRHMSQDLSLEGMPGLETLASVVAHHHEYLDGSGYPEGLRASDIPLASRMVTVVDIFDALTCIRPYKRSWQIDEAFAHLEGLSGDKIDRDCFRAMHAARTRFGEIWRSFHPHPAT